jgi:nitroreductase
MSTTPSKATVLTDLAASRRSVRSFKSTPVPQNVIEEIVATAALAPSNYNTQPWKVDVLIGAAKHRLTQAIMEEHRRDDSIPSLHFPNLLPAEHRKRQQEFGALFYGACGIGTDDQEVKTRQLATNYNFFGAPVGLIVSIESSLLKHSWLDCGLFLQTLMLAAVAHGYGTCAQVVFARHEPTILRELHLPVNRSVVCGLSLGVPDDDAAINNIRFPRESLNAFCTFRQSI